MKGLLFFTLLFGLTIAAQAQAKKAPSKTGPVDETTFFATIEHNGEVTEVKYTQFGTHAGQTLPDGSVPGRLILQYGASNAKDENSFNFQGHIPAAAKGSYQIGAGALFSLGTSAFPKNWPLIAKSGGYEIEAVPLKGGFVQGTFSVICEDITDDGRKDIYKITGSFKLLRQ